MPTVFDGQFVRLERDDARRIGVIRLDRPPMNALSLAMWEEIGLASDAATADDAIGAVVIWGGPKVFAAGADIKEFPGWTADIAATRAATLQDGLQRLAQLSKPTIAAVNGYALGGGCEVSLACDFRFAAADAKFGQPEILLGLIPGGGGTQRLPRLVGASVAKELIFSGRLVDADEALAIGLVTATYPAKDVFDAACDRAAVYARGPRAMRFAKAAIDEGLDLSLESGLQRESSLFVAALQTHDAAVGIDSFIANGPGKAQFTGA
ncbi:MAG: enoyl-CoA hydratase/isomerase family protein [Nitriliruptoraceae bacterium]